jgi:hypothetical protein
VWCVWAGMGSQSKDCHRGGAGFEFIYIAATVVVVVRSSDLGVVGRFVGLVSDIVVSVFRCSRFSPPFFTTLGDGIL